MDQPDDRKITKTRWAVMAVLAPVLYVLSSGPILATACWLRERTRHDEFYAAFWLYLPLLYGGQAVGREHPLMHWLEVYIEWWFHLLGTVGPG